MPRTLSRSAVRPGAVAALFILALAAGSAAAAGPGTMPVKFDMPKQADAGTNPRSESADYYPFDSEPARDSAGRLYGITASGGSYGQGIVYRVESSGARTVLHVFSGRGGDGAAPTGNLVPGRAGLLYGTTRDGGTWGCGTVFEISAGGQEKVLHSFTPSEGLHALGVLHADLSGNLYGATTGVHQSLYRLGADGALTILLQFA